MERNISRGEKLQNPLVVSYSVVLLEVEVKEVRRGGCISLLEPESYEPPHPQPISPVYMGEGRLLTVKEQAADA